MVTRAIWLAAFVAMLLGGATIPTSVAAAESRAILVLHTYGHETPGRGLFDLTLAQTFRDNTDVPVDVYIESLDAGRFGDDQARRTREYLRVKYAGRKIVVLVAVYDAALAFLLDPNNPLFPEVPVAAVSLGRAPIDSERVAAIFAGNTTGKSVALAIKLHPRAQRIAVISGVLGGGGGNRPEEEAKRQIEAVGVRLPVTFLHAQELNQLLADVRALPDDTIILIARLAVRRNGQPMSNPDAGREISWAARVPVYVVSDLMVGSGPVGGVVIRIESQARQLAHLALRMAAGARHIPPAETVLTPMFDWRQLRRWGITESLLPTGSIIQFRELSLWDQYKGYILAAAAVVGLQSVLIAGLVVQRAKRRRTERALRESERQARETADRNRDLAGRLISAQEAERRRIARDLHDDLSQQLAAMGIMLSGLKRSALKSGRDGNIDQAVAALQDRTRQLTHTVRNISHELHPSVLDHAGLVGALQRHCAEIEQHHRVRVMFRADGDFALLTSEVALCLFRVAQEALSNALRHGRAHTIRVELAATNKGIELGVIDDGVGFEAVSGSWSGLGLRSMNERVQLERGIVSVESRPGHGTQVLIRIPRPVADTR